VARFFFLLGAEGMRKTHSTLDLVQFAHGWLLSHLTFLSKQRKQEKALTGLSLFGELGADFFGSTSLILSSGVAWVDEGEAMLLRVIVAISELKSMKPWR
jgi:hypothetical protein